MATVTGKNLEMLKSLYFEASMSVPEIAAQLGLPMDALYYAMRKNGWERRDTTSVNRLRFLRKPASFTIPEVLTADHERLKMLAVGLYWGEGSKLGNSIDFANSDVAMCVIFLRFLREVCHVDEKRLRGFIYCHETQDPQALIGFWGSVLRLPKEQFTKPYVRRADPATPVTKKHPNRMPHGLVHIRYADTKLHQRMLQWIDEYKTWAVSEAVKRTTL